MFGVIDIANIIDYVNAAWVIGAFFAGLLAKFGYEAWKKYKFKKVLSLSRNKAICGMPGAGNRPLLRRPEGLAYKAF